MRDRPAVFQRKSREQISQKTGSMTHECKNNFIITTRNQNTNITVWCAKKNSNSASKRTCVNSVHTSMKQKMCSSITRTDHYSCLRELSDWILNSVCAKSINSTSIHEVQVPKQRHVTSHIPQLLEKLSITQMVKIYSAHVLLWSSDCAPSKQAHYQNSAGICPVILHVSWLICASGFHSSFFKLHTNCLYIIVAQLRLVKMCIRSQTI